MVKRRRISDDDEEAEVGPKGKGRLGKFKQNLRIDRDDLDTEFIELPSMVSDTADELAYAISRRDKKKLDIDRELARLDVQMRAKLAKQEARATDTAVARMVDMDSGLQELREELIGCNEEVSRLFGIKEALSVKLDALDHLAKSNSATSYARNSTREGYDNASDVRANHARTTAGEDRRRRMPD